jgi:hypothetical protein
MEVIRRCRFTPYRKGMGPCFTLTIWDTYRTDSYGKSCLGYRLTARGQVVFEGEDFYCPGGVAIDSDSCVASLMGFLTLKPGDTDSDYFAAYTEEQMAYCDSHAESLAMAVYDRFGEF